jgi:uncharacterized protein involved in exopolysaccharide biosynthesis
LKTPKIEQANYAKRNLQALQEKKATLKERLEKLKSNLTEKEKETNRKVFEHDLQERELIKDCKDLSLYQKLCHFNQAR